MAFYPGQIVGNYQIVELLGQGGMATVYKAEHTKLNRYVALKVMYESYTHDATFLTRFEREAQIIARLDHPHIVPVHDYAEFEGTYYLVMKFIEGISLATALEDGPLELSDIRTVMKAISEALDYAHSQGVLHRDIKPSNIMLDTRGIPYLADFGLARTLYDGESSISRGMMVGTPAYMSPEQGMGTVELDSRSDIYSLGIVLYQLLAGRTPFKGSSALAIVRMHQTEIPPMPRSLNPEIPPGVEAVVLRAIAKAPDDRYYSAGELYQAFEDALVDAHMQALNPFERHSIMFSLAQPREKSATIPRDAKLPTPKPTERGVPTRKKNVPQPEPESTKPSGSRGILDIVLIVGFFAALIILIIVVVASQLNKEAPAVVIPTVANVPTLAQLPTDTPPATETTPPTATTASTTVAENTAGAAVVAASDTPIPTLEPVLPTAVPTSSGADQTTNGDGLIASAALIAGTNRFEASFSPFPTDVQPYEVHSLSVDEAQAAVNSQPNDPVARLSLIQALASQMRGAPNSAAPNTNPQELERAIQNSRNVGDRLRYVVTLMTIMQSNPFPPDLLFRVYADLLSEFKGARLYNLMRERVGAHLYQIGITTGIVPTFVLNQIGGMLDSHFEPLFYAMAARMYITANDLQSAQSLLNRAGEETAEVSLVRGDMLAALGRTAQAVQSWQQAEAASGAPAWVIQRAEEEVTATGG